MDTTICFTEENILIFGLHYRFRFRFHGNRYSFRLATKIDKISKTISDTSKLPFSFSSLATYTRDMAAGPEPLGGRRQGTRAETAPAAPSRRRHLSAWR